MGEIQVFTPEHAEAAAKLFLRAGRGEDRPPGKNLPDYFSYLHLSNPWARPDMPSLVYIDKGKVIGLIGVVPRLMEFGGERVTIATKSMYLVDPEHRNGPAAIQLLRRMLKGPQVFSWTDGASGQVSALWKAMGGHTGSLYAFNWIRLLRPFATLRSGWDRLGKSGQILKPLMGLLSPADRLLSKVPFPALREPVSAYSATPVSAEELLDCILELGWKEKFRPCYTAETFPWLMRETGKTTTALRMLIVSDTKGQRAGWLIYDAVRGGPSFVFQIGVREKDDFRNTLLALFRDAWQQGSALIKGSAIPQYLTTMTEEHCIFRHPYDRVVIHSSNPEIANAVRTGEAAITRLDGTGWLRFSRDPWVE